MASKPANLKLWNTIVFQARARFQTYPSPGASHWVHKEYVTHGGQFITTNAQTRKMAALSKKDASKVEGKEGKKEAKD